MSEFVILDASLPTERERWLALWGAWPDREVSAHPGYVELFVRSQDQSLCAALIGATGNVMFPLILRPLNGESWAEGSSVCDLTTPYGYGGPFIWGQPDADLFWSELTAWMQSVHAVCLFARLSLFPEQRLDFAGEVTFSLMNVVRRLDITPQAIWLDYEYKVRKNVSKARRNGLVVEVDLDGTKLEDFLKVYCATMNRRGAADRYLFPKSFFEVIIRELKGQFAFFHCMSEDKVISTELVLSSAQHIYSFLGGTLAEAFDLRPNDLLKHAIVEWGQGHGKRAFVLGGGYADDDGIFRYKRSFAPQGVVPFCVGMRVNDLQAYAELIRKREAWEHSHGRAWQPADGFFPAYRA